ncbi:zinc metalloproteinase nas-4-like [Anabrus simplex]|uniref:zinc metalloproteinase nas-4-like n=1 Tax=Anabrus simplex TaxID=316456 RepID=UPI0035A334FB
MTNLTVNGKEIEQVESFLCLGSIVTTDGGAEEDVRSRIRKANEEEFPELGDEYQGDIMLPFSMTRSENSKNAVSISSMLWPGGVIPYVFHSDVSDPRRMQIRKAMSVIEEGTCIRFIPWSNEAQHIEITSRSGAGCYSMVGRQVGVGGSQPVNLEYPGCFTKIGTIEHELLHVVGLLHEQARPDRNKFVEIKWQNIEKDHWPDFYKAPEDKVSTFGVPYGYKSIMHYPKNAFTKNGKPTIVSKMNPNLELGQRDAPTKNDLLKVRRMYRCPNTP